MKNKQISFFDELVIDNFAGGGGASTGIELAIGRSIDIAINHDPAAIAMHKVNHPQTKHYCESVWDVDPVEATGGRPVGLAWFSPDCKHFSKAKGGKPVEKKIRGLAWIVLKWAGTVKPRVIVLENVEEFQDWGPIRKGRPIKNKKGQTFTLWKSQLEVLGYNVEFRELRACDYGAPTIRKRFFLIARCDGNPIIWPKATHGDPNSREVQEGKLKRWRSASEIIDWSLPSQSIFERKKPLAENTIRRITRGLDKFVLNNADPFIMSLGHTSLKDRNKSVDDPLRTIVSKAEHCLVVPHITKFQQHSKGQSPTQPLDTVMPGATRFGCVNAELKEYITPSIMVNTSKHSGSNVKEPLKTVTTGGHHFVSTPYLIQYHSETAKAEVRGQDVTKPIMTIDASPRYGVTVPFINKYYGTSESNDIVKPLNTITTRDRFSLVNVRIEKYSSGINLGYWPEIRNLLNKHSEFNLADDEILLMNINGQDCFIADIGMRMLVPRELYNAQGFPQEYSIEFDCNGKIYAKTKQVARCGNAVPPPFAEAIVRANRPDLCVPRVEITKYAVNY